MAGNPQRILNDHMATVPPPPIIPVPNITQPEIEVLVSSLYEVLECVMSRYVTEDLVRRTEYAIRNFLSEFHAIDMRLKATINTNSKKSELPSFISSYNFCCLMNVPNAMRRFGPLRELWEGSSKGEGALPRVKSNYRGMQPNWHYNLLQSVFRDQELDHILGYGTPKKKETIYNLQSLSDQYVKYSSVEEVNAILNEYDVSQKKPLCALLLVTGEDVRIFSCIKLKNHVVEIKLDGEHQVKKKFGRSYYKFKYVSLNSWDSVVGAGCKVGYAMMLPLLNKTNQEEDSLFAMVSSNWKWLSHDNKLFHLVDT